MTHDASIRAYYEAEALLGLRSGPKGVRVGVREDFVALLRSEGRRSVLDAGSGPGLEVAAFNAAGLVGVGLDVAVGNAARAAEWNATVVAGSVMAPPFRPRSIDACWSMSVLMHLDDEAMSTAVAGIAGVLRPGAPLFVGLWGGHPGAVRFDCAIEGQARPFFGRSAERNAELLGAVGTIEFADFLPLRGITDLLSGDEQYHLFRVRIPG